MNVIAFRSKDHQAADTRAAELPDRLGFIDPTNPLVCSPLGRAHIAGWINKAELDAGMTWGSAHSRYIDTIMRPDNYEDSECEKAARAYKRGCDILATDQRKRVFHAVMALAAYGEDWGDLEYTAKAAQPGLKALSDNF
jgi:hypothetical protein